MRKTVKRRLTRFAVVLAAMVAMMFICAVVRLLTHAGTGVLFIILAACVQLSGSLFVYYGSLAVFEYLRQREKDEVIENDNRKGGGDVG